MDDDIEIEIEFDYECEPDAHFFDVEPDGTVLPWRFCVCGYATWGKMDELLTLTTMMRLTP